MIVIMVSVVAVIALASSGSFIYAKNFDGKILPGVHIGPVDVGGLTHEQAAQVLGQKTQEALADGLVLTNESKVINIPLTNEGLYDADASFDLIYWSIDETIKRAMEAGRSKNLFLNLFTPLITRISTSNIDLSVTIDKERIENQIYANFPEYGTPAQNSDFEIVKNNKEWDISITESSGGPTINTELIFAEMKSALEQELFLPAIPVSISYAEPEITEKDAAELLNDLVEVLDSAPYEIYYEDTYGARNWNVDSTLLMNHLIPIKKGKEMSIGFDDSFADALRELLADVIVPAKDARFAMENGRVIEFQGSQTGIEIDSETMIADLINHLGQKDTSIELAVISSEPTVLTSEVNDLGINEIIGVGTSDFSGSPPNRISNIKNGARLLNGLLIAPGETFSLLNALKPFTTENGYLPELVIKGDQIIPEIGGGLCQIGTTTFRAAMNSGLEIVERRNHSLVVSYYNDPLNGNPGTDATIYDPAPDFKFKNDTGNYILFATDVNTATHILTFTFWGTTDGRNGYYSAPVVSSWLGAGERQYIETLDLEPGVEKCQNAHPGANASFTYYIDRPDGSTDSQIFTSTYRALPSICLVGVEQLTEEEPEPTNETEDPGNGAPPGPAALPGPE